MIKAIIFDCFGVLTEESWQAYKAGLDSDLADEAHNLMQAASKGQITPGQMIEDLSVLTGQTEEKVSQAVNSGHRKNVKLIEYIKDLRKQGYKIGLLSNIGDNWIRDSLLTEDEQKLFDDMVTSYEVNMAKPNPQIFNLACERLGVSCDEAVLIDDINRYCQVAKQEGLKTITYGNFLQMKRELEQILST